MAIINGWGRGGWGSDAWGEENPVDLTGLAGTSALGSLSLVTNNIITLTELAVATGQVGSVTVSGASGITLEGLAGTGEITQVLVWGLVDTDQTPSWSAVSTTQTPSWSTIDSDQDPDWQKVA